MTIEEKAKAYDEAINQAKKELQTCGSLNCDAARQIFRLFPKLTESEDERTRKALIETIDSIENFPNKSTAIAYLEKQKSQDTVGSVSVEIRSNLQTDEVVRKTLIMLVNDGRISVKGAITSSDILNWLEKQKDIEKRWLKDREGYFWDGVAEGREQKKQDNEEGDFTIYHPQKNGEGKYECIPFSFFGSLASFSNDKDLMDFLNESFYDKEECERWCERENEPELPECKHKIKKESELDYLSEVKQKEQKPVETSDFKTKLAEYLQNNSPKDGQYVISSETILEMAKEELIKRGVIQKPVEWSEEDMTMLNNLIWSVHMKSISPLDEMDDRGKYERYENFLSSLPERFNLQPKQEWSEEDEKMSISILNLLCSQIAYVSGSGTTTGKQFPTYANERDWFKKRIKSLRPSWKPNEVCYGEKGDPDPAGVWKPSEEQMNALNALNCHGDLSYVGQQNQLISLYNDLKKLM